jgi:hypothetical protein
VNRISAIDPKSLGIVPRAAQPTAQTVAAHAEIATPSGPTPTPIAFPDWIVAALDLLETKFAVKRTDAQEMDADDFRSYGKLLAEAGEALCPALLQRLRERHTFRPSVAEVRAALDELKPKAEALPGAVLRERRIVSREAAEEAFRREMAGRLPSAAQHPDRLALRDRLAPHISDKRRAEKRAAEAKKAETQK